MPLCDWIRADSFGVVSIEKCPSGSSRRGAAESGGLIDFEEPRQKARSAAHPRRPSSDLVEAALNAVRRRALLPGSAPCTATRHRTTAAATRGAIVFGDKPGRPSLAAESAVLERPW